MLNEVKMKTLFFIALSLSIVSCSTINQTYEHFKTKEVVEVNPYDIYRYSINETPVTDGVANQEYLVQFKQLTCKKMKEDECAGKYKDMFQARLKFKYKNADIETIKEYCVGYPVECNNNKFLEQVFIASNNFKVDSIEKEENTRRVAQEKAETNAAVTAFLGGMAQAQQRSNEQNFIREQVQSLKTRSCSTNFYGNTINTNCH
jgi:hypothetical protein